MLTLDEKEVLYAVTNSTVGTCHDGKFRHEIIVSNIERRMERCGCRKLSQYLELVKQNPEEYKCFISAITIHTTSWFRETPHYEAFEEDIRVKSSGTSKRLFRVLSVACSTGQELYSFGLILEKYRLLNPSFEYELTGIDIDPLCIATAKEAVYPVNELTGIPESLRGNLLLGSGKTEGLFTLSKNIRSRTKFTAVPLQNISFEGACFNRVVCRNVLIYFSPADVQTIVKKLASLIQSDGKLILGHSESLDLRSIGLKLLQHSTYIKPASMAKTAYTSHGERILVIDDCIITRRIISKQLESGGYRCEFAGSAQEATELLTRCSVDLITLDLNMPGIHGSQWLFDQRSKDMKTPVIIIIGAKDVNAKEVLWALEKGAQEFIDKSELNKLNLLTKVQTLIQNYKYRNKHAPKDAAPDKVDEAPFKPNLILVGASTGGTEALVNLLRGMPKNAPPVMVVQHISPDFAKVFASRLSEVSGLMWEEPIAGKRLERGHIYMASGDYHIGVSQGPADLTLLVSDVPPENRHRPSVNFLFKSASRSRARIFAMLLTGMGDDGADGLLDLKNKGAFTFCQDEDSSVVFGMPKEAIKLGAAKAICNVQTMRAQINRAIYQDIHT